ncbi:MAG TPA: retropepsin-like aspartic protease [Allosphingosinicella sp.]|nr:retropepsin-like aspartic protease [Allosphingosinicella sp.]
MREVATGILLAAATIGAAPAMAQAQAAPAASAQTALEAAFEAAGRGDLASLEGALPGARGEAALLIRARLAAAAGGAAADPALVRLAGSHDPATRQTALAILTESAFANADYAGAARWGRALAEMQTARGLTHEAAGSAQTWRLAALLAGRGAMAVDGTVAQGTIPARIDKVGLPRIDIAVNGIAQETVFDTGANLSVLSAETARRMGVTMIAGETSVSNGVEGTVGVRVGVAERIEIAGTIIRNVPFLIIDDSNLTFPQVPGGYDIRAIIGLPVMRALGRVRVESAAGRFTVLPADPNGAGAPNLIARGNDLFVAASVGGRALPLHLDTGSNQTTLSALYAEAAPAAVAALQTSEAQRSSAGGTARTRVATWANAPIALAGRSLVLPQLPVALPNADGPPPRNYGVLGSNALRAFESYTLDFRAMRLELGEPVRSAAAVN